MNRIPKSVNIGDRFGEWTVTEIGLWVANGQTKRMRAVLLRCSCGALSKPTAIRDLPKRKACQSCSHRTHGHSPASPAGVSSEYRTWTAMRNRTTDPGNPNFPNYGGRGIRVCEQWGSFEQFLQDMGARPSDKHSLDRIDNNGPYAPDNCRWATKKQQSRNTRTNRLITHAGVTQTMVEWAEQAGLGYPVLAQRLNSLGWPLEKALLTPLQVNKSRTRRH